MASFEIDNRELIEKKLIDLSPATDLPRDKYGYKNWQWTVVVPCSLDWMSADGESSHDTLGH